MPRKVHDKLMQTNIEEYNTTPDPDDEYLSRFKATLQELETITEIRELKRSDPAVEDDLSQKPIQYEQKYQVSDNIDIDGKTISLEDRLFNQMLDYITQLLALKVVEEVEQYLAQEEIGEVRKVLESILYKKEQKDKERIIAVFLQLMRMYSLAEVRQLSSLNILQIIQQYPLQRSHNAERHHKIHQKSHFITTEKSIDKSRIHTPITQDKGISIKGFSSEKEKISTKYPSIYNYSPNITTKAPDTVAIQEEHRISHIQKRQVSSDIPEITGLSNIQHSLKENHFFLNVKKGNNEIIHHLLNSVRILFDTAEYLAHKVYESISNASMIHHQKQPLQKTSQRHSNTSSQRDNGQYPLISNVQETATLFYLTFNVTQISLYTVCQNCYIQEQPAVSINFFQATQLQQDISTVISSGASAINFTTNINQEQQLKI